MLFLILLLLLLMHLLLSMLLFGPCLLLLIILYSVVVTKFTSEAIKSTSEFVLIFLLLLFSIQLLRSLLKVSVDTNC